MFTLASCPTTLMWVFTASGGETALHKARAVCWMRGGLIENSGAYAYIHKTIL